jgi:hypothetical protein
MGSGMLLVGLARSAQSTIPACTTEAVSDFRTDSVGCQIRPRRPASDRILTDRIVRLSLHYSEWHMRGRRKEEAH